MDSGAPADGGSSGECGDQRVDSVDERWQVAVVHLPGVDLVGQLVGLLKWPRLDAGGQPVRYVAVDQRTRRPTASTSSLADAGLLRAATVVLAPAGRDG